MADAISELQAVSDKCDELFRKQEFKAMAELYTSNACVMGPGRGAVMGREGIQEIFRAIYTDTQVQSKSTVNEVIPGGDGIMIERGSFSLYDREGVETHLGKFMCVMKKIDGQWFVHWEAFNSDRP